MNDLTVTVTGWVATDPMLHSLGDGKGKVCAFRMGHTPRYRNGEGVWTDGDTEWLSIRVFRTGSQNVGESIHKGQPVVIHGRLRTNTWITNEGVERTELQIDASAVGHDLTKGTARFTRQMESASEEPAAPGQEIAATDDAVAQDEADVEEDAVQEADEVGSERAAALA